MSTTLSMWLGIVFVGLAITASVLQAWLWGFPMEPDPGGPDPNGKSTAPRAWVNVHRGLGVIFVLIYLYMMYNMLPRLWEYQFELPARTIIHACMGILIGVVLVTKLAIIRWFQHFGKALPSLGFMLLACTLILGTLSLPYAIRAHALTQDLSAQDNLVRVQRVLAQVEDLGVEPARVVSDAGFRAGRDVLTHKCSICHDMRTVLMKPRSASSWHKLVVRMADKPHLGPPITDYDIPRVTAYLVAISPDLQDSLQQKRKEQRKRAEAATKLAKASKATSPANAAGAAAVAYDKEKATVLFETKCSECHELSDVEEFGGGDAATWQKVVTQMIEDEEAEVSAEEAPLIIRYLTELYPKTG